MSSVLGKLTRSLILVTRSAAMSSSKRLRCSTRSAGAAASTSQMRVVALTAHEGHSTALAPDRSSPLKCPASAPSSVRASRMPSDRNTNGTGGSTSTRPQHRRCLVLTVAPDSMPATWRPSGVPLRPVSTTSISPLANSDASFCCHTGLGSPSTVHASTRARGSYAERLPPRSQRKVRCSSSRRRARCSAAAAVPPPPPPPAADEVASEEALDSTGEIAPEMVSAGTPAAAAAGAAAGVPPCPATISSTGADGGGAGPSSSGSGMSACKIARRSSGTMNSCCSSALA